MLIDKKNVADILAKELKKPLPGADAQLQMVPKSRLKSLDAKPVNPKKGGVLLLLYPNPDELMLSFIKRAKDGGVHSGQIAFPGGKLEDKDRDLIDTALREAEEEVGVDRSKINVLGSLSEMYIPVSNYSVLPIVGFHAKRPNFALNHIEVADLIEIPLKHFLDENNRGTEKVNVRGTTFDVPAFKANGHLIWGATAMMLNEFLVMLKKA